MKLGILTLQQKSNYGGILQTFALQKTFEKLGLQVEVINHPLTSYQKTRGLLRRLLSTYILKDESYRFRSINNIDYISKNTLSFIYKYLNLSRPVSLNEIDQLKYDFVCVGSDQVWRKICARPNFLDYFFCDVTIPKFSYAASIGIDWWEYSKEESCKIKVCLKKFKGISVRELETVSLFYKNLGIKPIQHIDPTLLLSKDEYLTFFSLPKQKQNGKLLMSYILDRNENKTVIEHLISEKLDLKINSVMPKKQITEISTNSEIEDCIFPSVEKWIEGFRDAEFVITDSFHGTVFSIIFNKPFITIGNPLRGQSRFNSLLTLFDMKFRLVEENSNFKWSNEYTNPIDVPALSNYQNKAIEYLKQCIM